MSWQLTIDSAPPSWRRTQLRSLLTRSRNKGRPDLPLLSVNLPNGVVYRQAGDSRPAPASDLSEYQVVHEGDLVMNQLGKPHGALGVSPYNGIISPAYFVARIRTNADSRFVHHLLRTRLYISEYERRGKYMPPSQFDISWNQFRAIPVALPSIIEQQAIADFLDAETARIDALIAKKRRLVRLLGARYREERRTRMLRGLDPITGSGLNVSGWRVAQLGVLIGLQRGHDLPIDRRMDGTVPVISSGGPSGWHDEAAVIGPGVVTGRYGTVGEVYYVDGPYWPLNTTLYVHDFRGQDPKWVYHLLSVLPLDSDSAKSAVTGINRNVIGILRVPVPPLNEQRSLARELDSENARVNQIVSKLQRQIRLITEHRQALITAAVTGQIEVPGAAA